MKLIVIFVILCKLAHWNNSNYISLLIAMYLYLARAQDNVKILLNYLGLLILYKVFFKKLRNITTSNTLFIQEQAFNNKVVSMWDNFEYRKNIVCKKMRKIVKFKSITIAFRIKSG